MQNARRQLPTLDGGLYLTCGGLETTLIFHDRMDLPHFATFPLMRDVAGRARLMKYYESYLSIAAARGAGFVLETATWRASADWGDRLGYSRAELAAINSNAIAMLFDVRRRWSDRIKSIVASGAIGPRGDGYDPGQMMSRSQAAAYHAEQIAALAGAGADVVTAFTMTNAEEAAGIVDAARASVVPVVISFTLETDGRLPTGQLLEDAILEVDGATGGYAAYFMINCAHPSHFEKRLAAGGEAMRRIKGLRANASRRSHQELNDAPDLDAGNPEELGLEYRELLRRNPQIVVLGGCCGTDHRHVGEIGKACCGRGSA